MFLLNFAASAVFSAIKQLNLCILAEKIDVDGLKKVE